MRWPIRLLRRRAMEEELEKELRFHIEERAAELMTRGCEPEEARRRARLELGGPEQVKEACRDARGTRWVEDLPRDARYGLRTLRQQPGFACVALLTLALGTGAATVMFTLINGVLLKPFAYRDPSRLLRLMERTEWSTPFGNLWGFTYPNYLDCRRESRALDLAVWNIRRGTVSAPGTPAYVDGIEVSQSLFSMLGVKVELGRGFLPEEDRAGAAPVAIVSHDFWERRYGGSAAALGARLVFDGTAYTIAGVMPAGFRMEDDDYDVITPIGQDTSAVMRNREAHGFGVWARLRPGWTMKQAQAELAVVGRRLAREYPESNRGRTFVAEGLRPRVGAAGPALWLLLAAAGLVLSIGCANIASLLLARAVSREREMAMRAALGAGRGRLARQCLAESAVMALAGGALGVGLAAVSVRPFVAWWPGGLPRAQEVALDWRVLLFAAGISLASGMVFGLAPALRAPARGLEKALRAGARTVGGGARKLHGAFVISEIAIAVVLLVSAGTLGRTLLRQASLDPGVRTDNVLTARTALSPAVLAEAGRARAAWRELLERARGVSGVEAVAMIDTVPMREGSNQVYYSTSAAAGPQSERPVVLANCVTPDYLKAAGIVLRRGRFLTDQDRAGAEPVAVIDEVMAEQAFPGRDPIGRQVWTGIGEKPWKVVGVVGHVRQWGLAADDQASVRAQLYYPFAQLPDGLVRRWSELMSIAVRTSGDPLRVVEPLRRAVSGEGGDQVLYEINTFEQLARATLARQRFLAVLIGAFAVVALLLACIGIAGVLAYLTSKRTAEIGLRMALGARSGEMAWMVLRQSLAMILAGAGLGACGALAAGRWMAHAVEGIRGVEPEALAAMTAVLVLAALAASYVPALRASRIDPLRALRQE